MFAPIESFEFTSVRDKASGHLRLEFNMSNAWSTCPPTAHMHLSITKNRATCDSNDTSSLSVFASAIALNDNDNARSLRATIEAEQQQQEGAQTGALIKYATTYTATIVVQMTSRNGKASNEPTERPPALVKYSSRKEHSTGIHP